MSVAGAESFTARAYREAEEEEREAALLQYRALMLEAKALEDLRSARIALAKLLVRQYNLPVKAS